MIAGVEQPEDIHQRFQVRLRETFLSGDRATARIYLQNLVDHIVVGEDETAIEARADDALSMMADARATLGGTAGAQAEPSTCEGGHPPRFLHLCFLIPPEMLHTWMRRTWVPGRTGAVFWFVDAGKINHGGLPGHNLGGGVTGNLGGASW